MDTTIYPAAAMLCSMLVYNSRDVPRAPENKTNGKERVEQELCFVLPFLHVSRFNERKEPLGSPYAPNLSSWKLAVVGGIYGLVCLW